MTTMGLLFVVVVWVLYAMMKNLLIIFILPLIFTACKENSKDTKPIEKLEFYSDNSNLTFKKRVILENCDSLFYFYRNGQIFKRGKIQKNEKPFGIWNLYSNDGKLREIREWFVIDGHSRMNRAWFLDKKGDTLAWRDQDSIFNQKEFVNDTLGTRATNYNVFDFNKDTIDLNEPIRGVAYCNSRRIRDYDSQIRVFFHSESENFNSPFPNDSLIRTDHFDNLKTDTINQKWFTDINPKRYGHVSIFGSWFKKPGKKLLRGYMEEYSYGPFKDKEIDSMTARVYFEKTIYVKDTIK
ncbi:hypothetical protein CJ739_2500 [Mariniflexile rhizosphaerae]|nr:hypothetical protein CJ739_2500 [Mariniflexile sp. TRM1-10]